MGQSVTRYKIEFYCNDSWLLGSISVKQENTCDFKRCSFSDFNKRLYDGSLNLLVKGGSVNCTDVNGFQTHVPFPLARHSNCLHFLYIDSHCSMYRTETRTYFAALYKSVHNHLPNIYTIKIYKTIILPVVPYGCENDLLHSGWNVG